MKKLIQLTSVLICTLLLCFCITPETAQAADGTVTLDIEVKYGQTEARSMLDAINAFRTGSEAWAWNKTDTDKT